ncbi:hypothetical protein J2T13_003226 [Paenibacillus sp. DS2015]|uniref:hypothetical protein n=1 Tax=Paenibacillus sp. DS2015 TaxID=3373917 RepID=UPI003D1FCAA8
MFLLRETPIIIRWEAYSGIKNEAYWYWSANESRGEKLSAILSDAIRKESGKQKEHLPQFCTRPVHLRVTSIVAKQSILSKESSVGKQINTAAYFLTVTLK